MTGSGNCDLAIGRYVLVHQSDPIALIRAAATHLRRGGAVAFHEVFLLGTWWSFPLVPLWEDTSDLINKTFLSPRGIRVNVVAPGAIRTPIWGAAIATPEAEKAFEKRIALSTPLGRIGEPDHISKTVLFLA